MTLNFSGGLKMISGAIGTFSSISNAKAKAEDVRSLGQFQANIARLSGEAENQAYQLNALISEENASLSLIAGEEDYSDALRKVGRQVGAAATSYAASGVNISTGTPLLVLQQLAAEGTAESLKLKQERQDQARNFRNEAILQRFAGEQAKVTGEINARGVLASSEIQANELERQADNASFNALGSLFSSFGG